MGKIITSTLADQVYADLRDRIMSGELAAGHRLFPDTLATTLAISPTPVKEALLRLQNDGLVATEARRGAVVRRFTAAEAGQLCAARALLEHEAVHAGFADGRIDAALVTELEDLLARQVRALKRQDLAAGLDIDRGFHARIVALASNELIAAWHQQVMLQTHTIQFYARGDYALERMKLEHRAIIEGFAGGDAQATLAAVDVHLRNSRDDLLRRLAAGEK